VRSASPYISRVGVLAICGLLLVGVFVGCSTTQEKAARQQAQSKRILEAREKRQKQKKSKSHDHGGRKR
jgi:hypothetical protein